MEKELENPEKKKRRKQPSHPTKPSQPARPRHLTGRPCLSAAVLPHARPPSLARCPVGPTCRCQFPSPVRSLSICLAGPVRQCRVVALMRPLFSLCAEGLPCQFRLPRARRGLAHVHSRMSSGFSATTPAHVPSSPFYSPGSAPRTPLASLRSTSPSLALCPRRQPPPETRARVPDHLAR